MESRISRFRFVAGTGTAFLAACAGPTKSILPGAFTYQAPLDPTTIDVRTSDLVYSTSPSGHAVAMHTAAGKLFHSVAFSKGFMRVTAESGTRTVYHYARVHEHHWTRVGTAGKVRYVTLKSGKSAVMFKTSRQSRMLFHWGAGNYLYIRAKSGSANEIRIGSPSLSQLTPAEALEALVHSPGTWTEDDDFIAEGGRLHKADKRKRAARRRGSAVRRSSGVLTTDAGDTGDTGDGDSGDSCDGDSGDAGDTGAGDTGDIGDSGGDLIYYLDAGSSIPGKSRRVAAAACKIKKPPDKKKVCDQDREAASAAYYDYLDAVNEVVDQCIIHPSALCAAAGAAKERTKAAYLAALAQLKHDKCK